MPVYWVTLCCSAYLTCPLLLIAMFALHFFPLRVPELGFSITSWAVSEFRVQELTPNVGQVQLRNMDFIYITQS